MPETPSEAAPATPAEASRRRRRLPLAERVAFSRDVARRYTQDLQSIRQIAADLGRSYGCIHRNLNDAGIALRSRGGRTRPDAAVAQR